MIKNDQIQFKQSLSKLRKERKIKRCIWGIDDDSDCEGKVIKAHSIQNNRILSRLAEKGKVKIFSLDVDESGPFADLTLEGVKKFSTFEGFCQKHDKKIFQPIEYRDFSNSLEQRYLFAYRAATKEYHSKSQSIGLVRKATENANASNESLGFINNISTGDKLCSQELQNVCNFMKKNIQSKEFSGLKHYVFSFNKEYPVACCASFIPWHDFSGNRVFTEQELRKIQDNANPSKEENFLFVNVFPNQGKTHVLISHFKKYRSKYKFLRNMEKATEEKMKILISNMIINYIENVAFSPSYIENKFNPEEIKKLTHAFQKNIIFTGIFSETKINLFR